MKVTIESYLQILSEQPLHYYFLVLSIFAITVLAGVNFVFRLRDKHNIAP